MKEVAEPVFTAPVKILFVVTTLDRGGAERQLVALVTGLDRQRFLPVVCSLSPNGPLLPGLAAQGVRVVSLPLRGMPLQATLVQLLPRLKAFVDLCAAERPAIVHGVLFHAYVLAACAARLAGVPAVIASRRGLGYFKVRRPHYLLLERLANRLTDLIVANAQAVRDHVVRQERVDPAKVQVIHNGIDPTGYDATPDPTLRRELMISEETRVIGVVANLIHYKGHAFLLQACRRIRQERPTVVLLIGDGPLRGRLEALAGELGIRDEVRFLGSRPDIPQLLALVDVAVLPSVEEGLPNAVLEAMAAGKPVVATRVGGIPEAVVHGETGLLVPPRDSAALAEAILWLLQHPAEAARFGAAGRRRVGEHFQLSTMVRQYEAVYERLVAEKGRVRPAGSGVERGTARAH